MPGQDLTRSDVAENTHATLTQCLLHQIWPCTFTCVFVWSVSVSVVCVCVRVGHSLSYTPCCMKQYSLWITTCLSRISVISVCLSTVSVTRWAFASDTHTWYRLLWYLSKWDTTTLQGVLLLCNAYKRLSQISMSTGLKETVESKKKKYLPQHWWSVKTNLRRSSWVMSWL